MSEEEFVRAEFEQPIPEGQLAMKVLLFFGNHRGNHVIMRDSLIIGVRARKEDVEEWERYRHALFIKRG